MLTKYYQIVNETLLKFECPEKQAGSMLRQY